MSFDKVIPGIRGTIGTWLNPLLFQDIPNRLPADLLNTQLAKFANNPCVTKPSRLGDLDHQLTNLSGLSLSPFGILGLGFVFGFIANPPEESGWRNNRDQFFDRPTDHFAIFE